MDLYYIKERLDCTEEEKLACMTMVQWIVKMWKVAATDGFLGLQDEVIASVYYHEHMLLQVVIPLLDSFAKPQSFRSILEGYIVLEDIKGRELLEALIILEGFCGIAERKHKGEILETIGLYFGIRFRKQFYDLLIPEFLVEKFF